MCFISQNYLNWLFLTRFDVIFIYVDFQFLERISKNYAWSNKINIWISKRLLLQTFFTYKYISKIFHFRGQKSNFVQIEILALRYLDRNDKKINHLKILWKCIRTIMSS